MPTKAERKQIANLVAYYKDNQTIVAQFMRAVRAALRESPSLSKHIHSMRSRTKSPKSLKAKLLRKVQECRDKGRAFSLNQNNLLSRINDLAGVRILHLHTRQFTQINKALKDIFREQRFRVVEGPFARTWDDESRAFFAAQGVKIEKSPTLYTSVHYVIESASRTKVTCEIQVRTLLEEVWGEVDHAINYPNPSRSLACREQIKALARATSAATRLVDSIFATVEDFDKKRPR